MYLYLDTTERDSFQVALIEKDKVIKHKIISSTQTHSEKLLRTINSLLNSVHKTIKDVKGIAIVEGPGSFTSLRVGMATANGLSFALNIPVMGVEVSTSLNSIFKFFNKKLKTKIVLPKYGREPHITSPKF